MAFKIAVGLSDILDGRVPTVVGSGEVGGGACGAERTVNPADRAALELALGLAQGPSDVVWALTVGPPSARTILRFALARGATHALHLVHIQDRDPSPGAVAAVLAAECRSRGFNLLLCGDRNTDGGSGLVGAAAAEMLGWPQVTRAVTVASSQAALVVYRLLERGDQEAVGCPLPAVITAGAFGTQRYVPARALMRTYEGAIEEKPVDELLEAAVGDGTALPTLPLVKLAPPRRRPKKVFTPASNLSAMERARLIAGGGAARQTTSVRSAPEAAAEQILTFLREHGFVGWTPCGPSDQAFAVQSTNT